MIIYNERNERVNIEYMERPEQELASQFIQPDDIVLELGGRYGSVSCVINSILDKKTNQVVVEPDDRVWGALEKNKIINRAEFNIVKGFVSRKKQSLTNFDVCFGGYGTTSYADDNSQIPIYTLEEIEKKFELKFNVIVADCEGFLEIFFDENPNIFHQLRMIIFEADYEEKCDYSKIRCSLNMSGFVEILGGSQNVWIKM